MAIFYEAERGLQGEPVLINVEMIKSVTRQNSGKAIVYLSKFDGGTDSYTLSKSYEEVVADLKALVE